VGTQRFLGKLRGDSINISADFGTTMTKLGIGDKVLTDADLSGYFMNGSSEKYIFNGYFMKEHMIDDRLGSENTAALIPSMLAVKDMRVGTAGMPAWTRYEYSKKFDVLRVVANGHPEGYRLLQDFVAHTFERLNLKRHLKQFSRPQLITGLPAGSNESSKDAMIRAVHQATLIPETAITVMPQTMAGYFAVDPDKDFWNGCMVVDFGGGVTSIGGFEQGHMVYERQVDYAGDNINELIRTMMLDEHGMDISYQMAEAVKVACAAAMNSADLAELNVPVPNAIPVTGTDGSKRSKTVEIDSDMIYRCIEPAIKVKMAEINIALTRVDERVKKTIHKNPIIMTGRGSLMYGLDKRIERDCRVKAIRVPISPNAVIKGLVDTINTKDLLEIAKKHDFKKYSSN
jgi:rod shape-determining protein MreB